MAAVVAVSSAPGSWWLTPEWADDDIFKLSKVDVDTWKNRIANVMGLRWRLPGAQHESKPFAKPVAGLEAITQCKGNQALLDYTYLLRNAPKEKAQLEE